MAKELVPLKVKIGLAFNGHALYPDFNSLPVVQESGLDWSRFVDLFGLGWHYDKTSGHKEQSVDSPFGQQLGVLIVPKNFVKQAIAMFPDTCARITETELENFYDNKSHAHEPDELFDMAVLKGIKIKHDLDIPLTTQQLDALDPEKDTRGIRRNKRRRWTDYKALMDVVIDESI